MQWRKIALLAALPAALCQQMESLVQPDISSTGAQELVHLYSKTGDQDSKVQKWETIKSTAEKEMLAIGRSNATDGFNRTELYADFKAEIARKQGKDDLARPSEAHYEEDVGGVLMSQGDVSDQKPRGREYRRELAKKMNELYGHRWKRGEQEVREKLQMVKETIAKEEAKIPGASSEEPKPQAESSPHIESAAAAAAASK